MGIGIGALIALGVGAAATAGGSYLNAQAASKRKKELAGVANTPGVNFGDVYGETLGASQAATPQAEALARGQNTFNQAELDRLINESIPGYKEAQAQRIRNAQSDLSGEISPDVSAQLFRRGAASGVDSGTAGSQFNRNLVARDLGLTSLDLQGRGGQEFDSIIGTTPMAPRVTSGSLLTIDPRTGLAVRSDERRLKLDLQTKKALSKGATETYGEALTSTGGALMSYGMGT